MVSHSSVQTLKSEFSKVQSDIQQTLTQLQLIAEPSKNEEETKGDKVSVDRKQLDRLIQTMTGKISLMSQIGTEWENICDVMGSTIASHKDKSRTLKRKVKDLSVQ